jgi:hypothetical protein
MLHQTKRIEDEEKNLKLIQKFGIEPDNTTGIQFEVNIGNLTSEDISVLLVGSSINNSPFIDSSGNIDGSVSIVNSDSNSTTANYEVGLLLKNNKYEMNITIGDHSFSKFFYKIIHLFKL